MLRPGDILGPYELIAKIGKGSFGNVWQAKRCEGFGPEVAIKILGDNNTDEEAFEKAFEREVTIWIKLGFHPNIMQIIEANTYKNHKVIVSHYTSEGSLASLLENKNNNDGALSEEEAIELTLGILKGIAHLHKNDVIHSDLAPKNILLQGGIPRLIDFGVSKELPPDRSTVEGSSGTPIYKAPEVYDGEISRRSDIWSVGVIFYQLVCGKLPFETKNPNELYNKIRSASIPPLPPSTSPAIQEIIHKALEKDRRKRFQSAKEMIEQLKFTTSVNYFLSSTFKDFSNNEERLKAAIKYRENNRHEDALRLFSKIIEQDPKNFIAHFYCGEIFDDKNYLSHALEQYNKVVGLNPDYSTVYYKRGIVYYKQNNDEAALKDFNRVIEQNVNILAYVYRANIYMRQNNDALAFQDYNRFIEKYYTTENSSNKSLASEAYIGRGSIYLNKLNFTSAKNDFDKAISLEPSNPTAYHKLGLIYYKEGDVNTAIDHFKQAIKLSPKNSNIHTDLGIAYHASTKFILAKGHYDAALTYNNKNAEAYYRRGLLYHDGHKDLFGALEDYDKAIEYDSKHAEAYYRRGIIADAQNRTEDALENYNKAISYGFENSDIYYKRGMIFHSKQDTSKAESDYQKALNLDEQNPEINEKLGDLYKETGQKTKAYKHFVKAKTRYTNPTDKERALKKGDETLLEKF
jgi:serine/threonine protein kinase